MNDSSTGGYLVPAASPAPLEDGALYEALQAAVVGITGLAGTLVRPRWQAEPAMVPQQATTWCAIGVTDREADIYPYVQFFGNTQSYQLQRHEIFVLLCSFYGLGYNNQDSSLDNPTPTPGADYYAALLRDGLAIPQNLEVLSLEGIYLVAVEDLVTVPVLVKQRWMYRVDLKITLRREIDRTYPVLSIETVNVDLYTDDGQPPRILSTEVLPVLTTDDGSEVLTTDGGIILLGE
jgi:hypothetical protein